MHSIMGASIELECDGCTSVWRAAGAVWLVRCHWCGMVGVVRLVQPNQLLLIVLLVLRTTGVRREVGTNNHHNSFPPLRWAW